MAQKFAYEPLWRNAWNRPFFNASIAGLTDVIFDQNMLYHLLMTNKMIFMIIQLAEFNLGARLNLLSIFRRLAPRMLNILNVFLIDAQYIERFPHWRSIYWAPTASALPFLYTVCTAWHRLDRLATRGADFFKVNLFFKPLQWKNVILDKFYSIGGLLGVWQWQWCKSDDWILWKLFKKIAQFRYLALTAMPTAGGAR